MKESYEQMQQRLMQEAELEHADLRQAIEKSLTDERLESEMELLMRQGSKRGSELVENPIPCLSYWDTLRLKRIPQAVCLVFAGLATISLLWFGREPTNPSVINGPMFASISYSPINLKTPMAWSNPKSDQPWTIKLELALKRATFDELGIKILAKVDNQPSNTLPGLHYFQITFEGTNRLGARIWFTGSLVVTNSPGRKMVRNSEDMSGALLTGMFKVENNPDVWVSQSFAP